MFVDGSFSYNIRKSDVLLPCPQRHQSVAKAILCGTSAADRTDIQFNSYGGYDRRVAEFEAVPLNIVLSHSVLLIESTALGIVVLGQT
jgi:hypothetical protein